MKLAVVGSAVAVLAVVGGGVAAGVLTQDEVVAGGSVVRAPADAVAVPMELTGSRYGVGLQMGTRVREATTVTAVVLRGAAEEVEALPYDRDGEDLTSVPLAAGAQVGIEGHLSPDCGQPDAGAGDVVVEISTRAGSDPVEVRSYVPDDPGALAAAVADWCSLGPDVEPIGSMTSPDGTGEVYLDVANPGPGAVEVSLPAGGGWEAATVTVPAGTARGRMTLRASSADCDIDAALPWADGRLLVDGEPFPIALEDSWCG